MEGYWHKAREEDDDSADMLLLDLVSSLNSSNQS